MSKDFKYKDYVNKLRFIVGSNCPAEFDKYWENFVKERVYSCSLAAAKSLYEDSEIDPESCEIITHTVAEWTFHKCIDLVFGQIPDIFIDNILEKINSGICDFLKDKDKTKKLRLDGREISYYVNLTEEIADEIYKNSIEQLHSDKRIDNDTYEIALAQSHKKNYSDCCNVNDEPITVKTDVFERFNKKKSLKAKIKQYFSNFNLMYLIALPVGYIYLVICNGLKVSKIGLIAVELCLVIFIILYRVDKRKKDYCKLTAKNLEKPDTFEELPDEDSDTFISPTYMYKRLGVDILSLRFGAELLPYADPDIENVMLPAISGLRKELTDELGYIIPTCRVMDDLSCAPYECGIYIRSVRRYTFYADKNWTKEQLAENLKMHLRSCCIKYVNEIITKSEVLRLMELVITENPTLVNDLVPDLLSAIDLRRILVSLIREEIPIKDIILVFERLCDFARFNSDPSVLAERLRAEMAPVICDKYSVKTENPPVLYILTYNEETEKMLADSVVDTELRRMLNLEPADIEDLIIRTKNALENLQEHRNDVVITVSPRIRKPLFDLISMHIDNVKVMSFAELCTDINVEQLGEI